MSNRNVFQSVGSAGIGREYPQCLWKAITVDSASALCTFLSSHLAQYPVITRPSHNLICVLPSCDRSTYTVNNVAAHLHGSQRVEVVAFARSGCRCLSIEYFHETGDGSQICDDRDSLIRER